MRAPRTLLLLWLVAWPAPALAQGEWLFTPFGGIAFGGDTSFADLEQAAGRRKLAVGGSVTRLGDGPVGFEADFAYVPRFFQRESPDREITVFRSGVITLTGHVVVAAPVRITRESLRPYAVGGLGLMRAYADTVQAVATFDSTLTGLTLGGGVLGPISDRASLRLDVRHFRALGGDDVPGLTIGAARVSFWRATLGLALRY